MTITTTPRFGAPLLAAAQAQKHVTHNEALEQLDALVCARFLDRDLSAPPSSSVDGDAYLVKGTATGAWATHDGAIAQALDGTWRFYAPFTGLVAYVADEQVLIVFTGSAWVDYASILVLQNVPRLGINAAADSTNKLVVASSAVLFDNIGNGVQAKLNKHAAADTVSLLFQTNYSGRAEVGLAGDDDLHIKVSADGSTWFEALKVARSTGLVTLAGEPTATGHAATKQYVDRAAARHLDVTGSLTVTSAQFGAMVNTSASGGAATTTLPASATDDDWIAIRKADSSSNRVTVKNSGGTDIAWLSAQYDQVIFAWWGAWIPVWWSIAPLTNVFTASGTFTKPPLAKSHLILTIGAGGGGGSGRRGSAGTTRGGGGGASSGPINLSHIPASAVGTAETVTIGAGGSGGAAVAADSTDGNSGSAGGATSLGTLAVSPGGNSGSGGSTSGGSPGPAVSANHGNGIVGTIGSTTANAAAPGDSAGAGPGAGGGGISSGNVANAGGNGGAGSTIVTPSVSGGTGGANTGGNGGAGTAITNSVTQCGGSGGGGGGANASGVGGSGGAGGAPGGGGGGGGGSINGSNSGAGGSGARGEVRVTTYF